MTTTPKPTPPRRRPTLALPTLPTTPDTVPDLLGHLDAAHALMAHADQHAADAIACRALDEHGLAGQFRERERLALKRADLLVAIHHAEALDHCADALNRIALGL